MRGGWCEERVCGRMVSPAPVDVRRTKPVAVRERGRTTFSAPLGARERVLGAARAAPPGPGTAEGDPTDAHRSWLGP